MTNRQQDKNENLSFYSWCNNCGRMFGDDGCNLYVCTECKLKQIFCPCQYTGYIFSDYRLYKNNRCCKICNGELELL